MSIEHILEQATGLFRDTIETALYEDFTFKTEKEVKLAINFLITQLKELDPLDFVQDLLEDDDDLFEDDE